MISQIVLNVHMIPEKICLLVPVKLLFTMMDYMKNAKAVFTPA